MGPGQKAASALLGAWCVAALSGCGDGLGECDRAALGGNPIQGMSMPHDGQRIVAEKCTLCHSVNAMGEARVGAPAGLNFDVIANAATDAERAKIAQAAGTVIDWAEDIWDEIEGGTMPPPKPAGGGELNDMEKESVRNWLACGAPLIGPDPTVPAATWDSIWPTLRPNCVTCHSVEGGVTDGPGQGFILGDEMCAAYNNITGNKAAVTPECSMMPRTLVIPNDPDGSLLIQKISATQDCGMPMPPSAEGLQGVNPVLVDTIKAWIAAGAQKPASCP